MANMDDDLSSVVYYSPQWIAQMGTYLHSNNVLFYFAESPFFDRTSTNQSIITQSSGIPEREFENLSTRKRFETKLSQLTGLQYVVAHDPLESNSKFKGPNGEEQADIWVIRRQYRHKAEGKSDDVTVTGYYYIMNQAIFQAPSVANILSYRMLNTTIAVNQIFSTASTLPMFSVSHGHTYHKPVQKTVQTSTQHLPSADREATPIPAAQTATEGKGEVDGDSQSTTDTGARTLRDALSLSMRYGKEYMDEMPLMGEPGSFRFAKTKEAGVAVSRLNPQSSNQTNASKVGTPVPASRVASPPALQTDLPDAVTKKSTAKSPRGDNPMKPKRKKSKAVIQTP